MARLLIWQVTNDDTLLTWWILKCKQEEPIETGCRVLCLDSEGEWDMVQLAHSSSALVTSNTRHLGLLGLLRSNDVHIEGKGLSGTTAPSSRTLRTTQRHRTGTRSLSCCPSGETTAIATSFLNFCWAHNTARNR